MNYVELQKNPTDSFLQSFNWDESSWVSDTKPTETQSVHSIWEEMATGVSSVGSSVWDAAKGAWISTKETAIEAYAGLKNEIKDTGGGLVDYLQNKLIIIVLLVLALLYVAGKSGFFSAAVAVAK